MSRLLFAAARGARIQTKTSILSFPVAKNRWATTAAYIPTADYKGADFRIHPADEHLAYGPISTALREVAEDARAEIQPHWEMGLANFSANNFIDYYDWRWCEPDYPLYYLILAEFLADSGL